jgi:hypothetical protein
MIMPLNVRFKFFTAVAMKMLYFWMWHYVSLVRPDVSAERAASILKVEGIRVLGTALAVTSGLNQAEKKH